MSNIYRELSNIFRSSVVSLFCLFPLRLLSLHWISFLLVAISISYLQCYEGQGLVDCNQIKRFVMCHTMVTRFLVKCGGISILKFSTSNTGSLHKATGVTSAQTPDNVVFVHESESLDGRGGREGVNDDRKEEVIKKGSFTPRVVDTSCFVSLPE